MKYFIPALLGLALSLANFQALGGVALAQESGEFNHEFSKDGRTLIKVDPNATSLNIPKSVDGMYLNAFQDCSSLKSITVEKGNTTFFAKDGVLFNKPERKMICYPPGKSGENYAIPNGTVTISFAAFNYVHLKAIKFPATLENFEGSLLGLLPVGAFYVAKDNKKFSASNGALFDQSGKTLLRYPSLKKDKSYTVPKDVVAIAEHSFAGVRTLKSVDFEEGVVSIERKAFASCLSLESVKLPNSLENIEAGAFVGCFQLKSIEVSESNNNFKSIDGVLFSRDGSLLHTYPAGKVGTSYKIPVGVENLGDGAFVGCKLKEVELPESARELGAGAFAFSEALRKVKLPSTMEKLGEECFSGCSSLESLSLPRSLKSFGKGAFNGCSSLPKKFRALDDEKNPAYGGNGEFPILGENITVVGVDLEGNEVPIDEYKGKVVLVDCWTTERGPYPVEDLYEKYHDKGFEVISYNGDADLEKLAEYDRAHPHPWKTVSRQFSLNRTYQSLTDEKSDEVKKYVDLSKAYSFSHVSLFPTTVLIGRDGKVVVSDVRYASELGNSIGFSLDKTLERLFSDK